MKKLFTFCLLILITISMYAQSNDYELYKCGSLSVRTLEDSWTEWKEMDCDLIIRLCLTDEKIEFNNPAETVFFFDDLLSTKHGIDSDNDKYVQKKWKGFDNDGLKCVLTDVDYPSLINRTFTLEYANTEIFFSCILLSVRKENPNSNPKPNYIEI